MRLTYWKANCTNDSDVYSIRAKTKKECFSIIESYGYAVGQGYDAPHKVTVEYRDAFDLLTILRSEDACSY